MEWMHFDRVSVDAGTLQDSEQPVTVCVEILRQLQDLEHVHLVPAVGSSEGTAFRIGSA